MNVTQIDWILHFDSNHGLFGYWSELVFPPSRSTRPKRALLQVFPKCEPPPKERVGIFGEACEILEEAPGFRRYNSVCPCLQEKVGHKSFAISPIDWTLISPIPHAHHPLTIIISICYLFYICGFFRPVVAHFLPLKIIIITNHPIWTSWFTLRWQTVIEKSNHLSPIYKEHQWHRSR